MFDVAKISLLLFIPALVVFCSEEFEVEVIKVGIVMENVTIDQRLIDSELQLIQQSLPKHVKLQTKLAHTC